MSTSEEYFIGIDVGTGSARAALVKENGTILASATQNTKTFRSPTSAVIFEQSTVNTWAAICTCTKKVLEMTGIKPESIGGIGFDATCSLAVTDLEGNPVSISQSEELGKFGERDIILWADHRAEEEANLINSTGSVVLDYVGGTMSLEMEIPKILWLKRHMPQELFAKCMFFDLPDYLTYKATGSLARSNCSLVCKCSFIPPGVANSKGWNSDFLAQIGLQDLVDEKFDRLGGTPGENGSMVLTAGQPVGHGLSKGSAADLGLVEGTPVGSAVIDAYAGWIGTVAARYKSGVDGSELSPPPSLSDSQHFLAAVAGTSTCHLIQSPNGIFVPGVWGPYMNALFPGWWMNEGGQSSTGQLIDFTITTHPAYPTLKERAQAENTSIHKILADTLEQMRVDAGVETLTELSKDLHMYPDLHGNRSPLADPRMRGSITGLALDSSLDDLALKFNITLEAIALQTKHIIDEMNSKGYDVQAIYMSGGQAANTSLMQLLSNVCNVPIILPHSHSAAVVVGSAMLGRFAAEVSERLGRQALKAQAEAESASYETRERLWSIMVEMTQPGTRIEPSATPKEARLLQAKYKIFRESIEIQRRWRKEIKDAAAGV
ncbi:hypothetical protein BOTBODRAFT_176136 [Botryobasidium botryosum FD-172 SS1]|uniref:Carbohydrate kinase FGGY C-terminal domain-containing protein n=1 Tax=Botryobasidium botryosum (strain FD-172 SS1) TaxID=930990 RepID=A0A067MM86_BOTB1|nr:hypothetical protein BOTBODRAFT_176136 [Botryobasidium botryosum FD-172 SS1]